MFQIGHSRVLLVVERSIYLEFVCKNCDHTPQCNTKVGQQMPLNYQTCFVFLYTEYNYYCVVKPCAVDICCLK